MQESTTTRPTPTAERGARGAWSFVADPFQPSRRRTHEVRVGDIGIGGSNPVRVQSMTVADTLDTDAVVDEIAQLHTAGCEIVRVTAPNRSAAENLAEIKRRLRERGVRVPLVADIHFTPQAALIAALHVEKVRVNPGNFADRKHFEQREYSDAEYAAELERLDAAFSPLVVRCKELGVAMRIGTNHGSLSDRILNRFGDTPLGMVESALEFVRICERHGFRDLVLSMKASDVKVMVQAYRLLAARMLELGMTHPFHLGVTEAGAGLTARVKSAVGIATLLMDGIGDTVRVSLTEDSVHELPLAAALARRVAPAPAHARAAPTPASIAGLDIDPICFEKRASRPVGEGAARLAPDSPPRIELVHPVPAALAGEPASAAAWLARTVETPGLAAADLVVLRLPSHPPAAAWATTIAAWLAQPAALRRDARPAIGFEITPDWLGAPVTALLRDASRVSLRLGREDVESLDADRVVGIHAVQYLATGSTAADAVATAVALGERVRAGALPHGALSVELPAPAVPSIALEWRRLLAALGPNAMPVVVRAALVDAEPIDAHVTSAELDLVATLGALAVDGIVAAIQLAASDTERGRALAAEILQSTRLRLSTADFIACPSCGRTQFDLQSTTAKITARLRHLTGLKIAVMGCIVNGPGEMADADFGYVGSGPGKIDLYVGKERVERGVPQAQAVDRLVDLIRGRGLWVEPAGEAGA